MKIKTMTQIPRIVHQVWFDFGSCPTVPEKYNEANASIKKHCSEKDGWKHMLWNESMAEQLLKQHYEWFLPVYEGYEFNISRVDAIRYFILHHYGGVYLDQDIELYRPINHLMDKHSVVLISDTTDYDFDVEKIHDTQFSLYENENHVVNNYFMASKPGHPFFERVMKELVSRSKMSISKRSFVGYVLLTTGPWILSSCVKQQFAEKVSPLFILPKRAFCSEHIDPKDLDRVVQIAKDTNTNIHFGHHGFHALWAKKTPKARQQRATKKQTLKDETQTTKPKDNTGEVTLCAVGISIVVLLVVSLMVAMCVKK
jgi:mannosyltransferase OCH1-like enzyme